MEGFAADAEYLGRARGESASYDNEFYRLCKLDNEYIFEFKGTEEVVIPPISEKRFEEIIWSEMKRGKSCDIYQLTTEHIQEFDKTAKMCILKLLNEMMKMMIS